MNYRAYKIIIVEMVCVIVLLCVAFGIQKLASSASIKELANDLLLLFTGIAIGVAVQPIIIVFSTRES